MLVNNVITIRDAILVETQLTHILDVGLQSFWKPSKETTIQCDFYLSTSTCIVIVGQNSVLIRRL